MSKHTDSGLLGLAKRVYLKYVVGYGNQQRYWNRRWQLGMKTDNNPDVKDEFFIKTAFAMIDCKCQNVLEVGCGRGKYHNLMGWVGLDFSTKALQQSGLTNVLQADLTEKIPLPDKAFDVVMCHYVLLHIPPNKIATATAEMQRVASKLIIVCEPSSQGNSKNFSFNHDYKHLFQDFKGTVLFWS